MLKRKYYILPVLLLAFTFTGNPPGGWYLQVMPQLQNMQISDIFFLDSLTGWAVTGNGMPNDSSGYILKTSNGGDNWNLQYSDYRDFSKVVFINSITGFVSGGYGNGARLYKSTSGGANWVPMNIPGGGLIYFSDMHVLNEDSIWLTEANDLVGGLYRTTNGGLNWTQQYYQFGSNPSKIYMFDKNIGFIEASGLRKTTDGGLTWDSVYHNGNFDFIEMKFLNSFTGWMCNGPFLRKTTNGGFNWVNLQKPSGGPIIISAVLSMAVLTEDTMWVSGPAALFSNGVRGVVARSTNGGISWGYQIPDTSINIGQYSHIRFINHLRGWAYSSEQNRGIRTITAGDTIFTSISSTSTEIPSSFILYQNYPNPFNPKTTIKYTNIKKQNVKLIIYSSEGKEIAVLINQVQPAGTYSYVFNAAGYTSGIYFYRLTAEDRTETKKAILIK